MLEIKELLITVNGPKYLKKLDLTVTEKNWIRDRLNRHSGKVLPLKMYQRIGEAMKVDYRLLMPKPDYEVSEEMQKKFMEVPTVDLHTQLANALGELLNEVREYRKTAESLWLTHSGSTYSLGLKLRLTVYPSDCELWLEFSGGRQKINCANMAKELTEILRDDDKNKAYRINQKAKGCEGCVCGMQF